MLGRRERRTEESLARLRRRLRAEAERHQPDTERIWAKVQAAMEQPADPAAAEPRTADPHRRPLRPRGRTALRVAAAALSTIAVVGAVSLAVLVFPGRSGGPAVTTGDHHSGDSAAPTRPPASPKPAPASPALPRTGETVGGAVSAVPASPRRPSRTPGKRQGGGAPVTVSAAPARGSGRHWARNELRLTVHRPLSALAVTIRITRGRHTFPGDAWTSLPGSDVHKDIDFTREALVYRFVLRPGRTVAPGGYLIAADYRPGGRHAPGGDAFTVQATAAGGGPAVTIDGRF
ncbi:hypothetical protein [Thermomonospora sp. CIF 1]|uniref:hypothetical protein n=1 Tax=Thermomonospora sp. CIF 1 TaxID=1916083 RepID=UPI000CC530E8|nr:hypothetical protein [Thermomonospora sp. CIF 1]PKK14671.1 MAG: hypothetical protein BUE48_008510 [Thermomonospora sp. CIF 1]